MTASHLCELNLSASIKGQSHNTDLVDLVTYAKHTWNLINISIATPALHIMIQSAISMQMKSQKRPGFFPSNSYSSQQHSLLPLFQTSASRQNPVFFFWKWANVLLRFLFCTSTDTDKQKPRYTLYMVYDPDSE